MTKHKINFSPIQDQGWGLLTQIVLPGGGKLGVYQPRHARPETKNAKSIKKRASKTKPRLKKKK